MAAVASLTRVRVVADRTMPTPLQRSTKLKISHWYFWSVSLPHQDFIFCQKHLEQAFFCIIFFTRIHLMRRLLSVVNFIAVTTLLLTSGLHRCYSKERLRRVQVIFTLLESALHYLFCLKFSSKLINFSKSYARKQQYSVFILGLCCWIQIATFCPYELCQFCLLPYQGRI